MSVTAATGFVANGIACGIKSPTIPDLAVVMTADGGPVPAAAVFTQNQVVAAPVTVSRAHLAATSGQAAGVILNSGNANACTGPQGQADAETMCAEAARAVGCAPEQMLVCSTGLIGPMLPMDRISAGIPELIAGRGSEPSSALAAADAILTTDTRRKLSVTRGDGFVVGGMAKGAAMLAPNMATMLAVLTTDAVADSATLQEVLRAGVADSFNLVTIDGCTSTNDTVILLGSPGTARGGAPTDPGPLAEVVAAVCYDLAVQMVEDAEGHTKVVRVTVTGAASDADAHRAARKVAESQLVKCSWYGNDAYWGRVASDLGTSGVPLDPTALTIAYGGVVVSRACVAVDHDEQELAEHMAGDHLQLDCDLGVGAGRASLLTNDLTHAYVDENMGTS
ncbi:MAG TPA: bifunctional glutamate N-acetyltransferase/amino-acid acetyltransferase ArgJ [Acidimicrobiales bacterium]|jgi:glutamate N-acetyltransferase/amino-acid N-acetyltransferase